MPKIPKVTTAEYALRVHPADSATVLVVVPPWVTPGARVRKVGSWPRVNLLDGTEGTVVSLDVFEGHLRWFKVKWDNHAEGVDHYGWHATQGNVIPASSNETSSA